MINPGLATENWSGAYHASSTCAIFEHIFPEVTIIIITCSLKLLGLSQSEGRGGTVIKSVISAIGSGWVRRKKSFTLIAQSRLPNRFQLQFWFHFLEDQGELMHKTQYEMDQRTEEDNVLLPIPLESQHRY